MAPTGIADKTTQPDEKAQGGTPVLETRVVGNEGNTKTVTPRTYSQEEVDALLGKSGQKMKAQLTTVTTERDRAATERDEAKKQLGSLNSELSEAKTSLESLQNDLDEMSKDDPDRMNVARLIKAKQAEFKALKDDRTALEPTRKEYEQWQRDQEVYAVADEYVNADDSPVDFDDFMEAANEQGIKFNERSRLTSLANRMGLKLKEEAEEETPKKPKAPKTYSGKSDGGTPYFTRSQFDSNTKEGRAFWEAHKDEIVKAQKEGRIRD